MPKYVYLSTMLLIPLLLHAADKKIPPCVQMVKPHIEKFPCPIIFDELKEFSYFPEGFYTYCENPKQYPLVTGPCSPCCALFISDPTSSHTLGFHIRYNNCLISMISAIDKYFPEQNGSKRSFLVTLFTHADSELHKNVVFKEGSHKERFMAIFDLLRMHYALLAYNLYFNDLQSDEDPVDRWVIYYGPNPPEDQAILCRVSAYSRSGVDFGRYNSSIQAERFGSMKAREDFLDFLQDTPLYETSRHSLSQIKSLSKIHVIPLPDGIIVQAFLPNGYHLDLPLGIKGLPESWITPDTSHNIRLRLEKFIENNRARIAADAELQSISFMFKEEIISYFIKTATGWELKKS